MPRSAKKQQTGFIYHLFDVALNIIIIMSVVGIVRTFLISPYQVEGNSMTSTLEDRQYIMINKLSYYLDDPQRGDVVVFRPPSDPRKHYVKRIIGTPGDTIVIKDGYVYIQDKEGRNEIKLDEDYLDQRNYGKTYRNPPNSGNTTKISYVVPSDQYFLLGDNRKGSLDSRSFEHDVLGATPYVPIDNLKGKVWFVALPITKLHALEAPEYGI